MGVCSSRSKPKNVILSLKQQKAFQVTTDNIKLLSTNEIKILSILFRELSLVNLTGKKLEKFGFLSFFKLPVKFSKGLFGIKLFEIFDKDQNNFIDVNEFISGIETFCRASPDIQARVLFELFCFNGNDFLTEDDLYLAHHHLLKKVLSEEASKNFCNEIRENNSHESSPASATFSLIAEGQKFAKRIFHRFSNEKNFMNFEDFWKFYSNFQEISKVFSGAFNEIIWKNSEVELTRERTSNCEENEKFCENVISLKHNTKVFAVINKRVVIFYNDEMKNEVIDLVYLPGSILKIENNKINIHSKPDSHPRCSFILNNLEKLALWEEILRKKTRIQAFSDHYELKELLGSGKYSEVYKGFSWKTRELFAVKIIKKYGSDIQEKEMVFNEYHLLQLQSHKNIVKFKGFIDTLSHFYIIEELAEGKPLQKIFHSLTEKEKKIIIKEILETLQYLHSIGIVHRDIKMENIVVNREDENIQVKLVDFGLSELKLPNKKLRSFCGTVAYMAPEFHLRESYDQSVDIWSLGVMAYTMIAKKFPFNGINEKEIISRILSCAPDFSKFSDVQREFVESLLNKDPAGRLTASEALNHPWIN